ncbi:hypothetical protein SLE2022_386850 [Rubroshorea leprosula]
MLFGACKADERVALIFFYWADGQWRYCHDPIVYYAMLEVLSRKKLCQGAKRVPLAAYKVACHMFNRNLIPDLKLCGKVSKKLTLEGKLEEADELMLQFVERGHLLPQCERILQ